MARVESLTTVRILELLAEQTANTEAGIADQHTADINTFASIDEPLVAEQHTADIGTFAPISSSWLPNTMYKAGQLIFNIGHVYSANVDFTSGVTFNATNWTIVSLSIPVANDAERNALTAYDGLQVYRLDQHITETYLGDIAQWSGTWIIPNLLNGFATATSGAPWGMRKREDGMVVLRGLIGSNTAGVLHITDIPVGYRPLGWTILTAASGNLGTARIDVRNDGVMQVNGNNAGSNISIGLDGLSWSTR